MKALIPIEALLKGLLLYPSHFHRDVGEIFSLFDVSLNFQPDHIDNYTLYVKKYHQLQSTKVDHICRCSKIQLSTWNRSEFFRVGLDSS